MADKYLPVLRNYMLLMHGETDKNLIVSSYAQFSHEFGECAGLQDAADAFYRIEGLLYVVQAKVFDDKKLEETAEFGKRAIYEIHCVGSEETIDMQLWMVRLAEKMNTVAYLVPQEKPTVDLVYRNYSNL